MVFPARMVREPNIAAPDSSSIGLSQEQVLPPVGSYYDRSSSPANLAILAKMLRSIEVDTVNARGRCHAAPLCQYPCLHALLVELDD